MTPLEGGGVLEHEAFLYDSDAGYVATLAPLVVDAVTAGRPVIAVVPEHNAELLRAAAGKAGDGVEYIDADEWYRQPAAVIRGYHNVLGDLGPAADPFVVGEVRFGATKADWARWTRYESVINHVLGHHAARVICPYDRRVLPPVVVDHAASTHPLVLDEHGRRHSDRYLDPAVFLARSRPYLPVPAGRPRADVVVEGVPREGRRAFARTAAEAGFAPDRIEDLSLAVNEILTNALVHGGGAAWLRVWADDDRFTCVVEDNGPGSDDLMLGYRPPNGDENGGYGVWLARHLFDDVELTRSPGGGLRVVLSVDS